MSYRLVIAEKPSVGAAYAKVLGATNRQDGYWEGNGYLLNGDAPHNNHLRERLTFLAQELEKITADLPVWG